MHQTQIDSILQTVPAGVPQRQRRRLDGYAAAARRCDERIAALRAELASAIIEAGERGDAESADALLEAMLELQALERLQLRVDAGLRASAGALAEQEHPAPLGEGPI
ncbi:MAG: hypothetical protein QM679_11010 [Patulibacter sp.]